MAVKINFDPSGVPEEPTIVLAKRNGDRIGVLPAVEIESSLSMNEAAEISFNVYKYDNGEVTPLWDELVDLKLIYVVDYDMFFEIKVEIDESTENTYKTVDGVQLGVAELSQVNLYNIQINTEDDILRDDYEIPTVLYYPEHPEASLLHRITEKIPHYRIKHVDDSIKKIQRVFEFDGDSIYDAFQEISEEIDCLFTFDSGLDGDGNIDRSISVYDLESKCNKCGYRGEFWDKCPECGSTDVYNGYGNDTGILVTSDELAESVQMSIDVDNIKNCFKLEGGDEMMTATIRNCNPNGSDYIWYISDAMKRDMSKELVARLDEYDKQYEDYYSKVEYKTQLPAASITTYNQIVERYRPYLGKVKNDKGEDTNKDIADELRIPDKITGYKSLMNIYYNVIDLVLFLRSSMMPTWKLADTDAKKEAAKLTTANISPVAAQSVTNMSAFTADNVVLTMAKVLVDTRYQVKVTENSSSFNKSSLTWTGRFDVTNYSDKEDFAQSSLINVKVNDNYETFVKQKIEKALKKGDAKDMSIAGLFKLELADFKKELRKYALNRLVSFNDACQSAIDILVEQGIADKNTWGNNTQGENLYDHLYTPYKQKLTAIQDEMNIRSTDIETIYGRRDENDAVVVKGLQNYIEDVVEETQTALDFEKYLGDKLWLEFCSFRREDKYTNDNYVSDGLTNSQLIDKANEFIQVANKEIYKSNELQTTVSANLYNLLMLDRFKPLLGEFELGNYIQVIVDGVVYKPRLIHYEIDYSDTTNLPVDFADNVRVSSTVKSVKDVINQASSMATSYNTVMRQAKQGNEGSEVIDTWFESGLDTTNTKIVSGADGQSQTWDNHGMLFRKVDVDGNYEPTQMKIINSTLAITDDDWKTTKTAVGEYYYRNQETGDMVKAYGVNAETIIGKLLLGENLLLNNEKGTVSFDERGLMVRGGDSNVVVSISPENYNVIDINNGRESVFNVNQDGDLYITGEIMARSLELDSGVEIEPGVIKNLANVATSGRYNDLVWGTGAQGQVLYLAANGRVGAKTMAYSEISGRPTNVTQFTNDAGYITNAVNNLLNYTTTTEMNKKFTTVNNNISSIESDISGINTNMTTVKSDISKMKTDISKKANSADLHRVATTGNYNDLENKPKHFSGNYNDLSNKPTLFSGDYNDLANKPKLSTIATNPLYKNLEASTVDAGKLMYIDERGDVTAITIDELKTLLGL